MLLKTCAVKVPRLDVQPKRSHTRKENAAKAIASSSKLDRAYRINGDSWTLIEIDRRDEEPLLTEDEYFALGKKRIGQAMPAIQ
jgi:hypothetical protein